MNAPRPIPRFPVSVVGSWPRPDWLLKAMKKKSPDLAELRDKATLLAIEQQEAAGVDVLSDGEQRRDNFYSFLTEKLDGVQLMSMAELLDYVEDKAAFEALLQALDVPAFAIKNPTITGRMRRREPLAVREAEFLRAHSKRATKIALPGPYLLSRSMWVQKLSGQAYPTRELLCDDVVRILREELLELAALAVELINRVVEGVEGTMTAVHVCRGNWSRQEDVLLSGDYEPLLPALARMQVDQFVLEYATPRAGPESLLAQLPDRCSVGFGAVNPRTEPTERAEDVATRVRALADLLGPDRIWLNPDCGFGTFAERPVATAEVAQQKLRILADAARALRSGTS